MSYFLRCASRSFSSSTIRSTAQNPSIQWTHLPGPPLYERRPNWWARWAWGLLALDLAFTTTGCDTIMTYWTQEVIHEKPSATSGNQTTPTGSSLSSVTKGNVDTQPSPSLMKEYELRPFWQRFGLSVAQVVFGAAAGAMILVSRERAVCRIQLVKALHPSPPPVPHIRPNKTLPHSATLPKSTSPTPSPVESSTTSNMQIRRPRSSPEHDRLSSRWVELETASGRKSHFSMRQTALNPGRDASELILQSAGMRGHFWIGLSGAKILGMSDDGAAEKSGGNNDATELRRDRFLAAWERKPLPSRDSGWVSGPVVN